MTALASAGAVVPLAAPAANAVDGPSQTQCRDTDTQQRCSFAHLGCYNQIGDAFDSVGNGKYKLTVSARQAGSNRVESVSELRLGLK